MCDELSEQLDKQLELAESLVDQAIAMGIAGAKIPVGGWVVEVREPTSDEERAMCKRALDRKLEQKHINHLKIV